MSAKPKPKAKHAPTPTPSPSPTDEPTLKQVPGAKGKKCPVKADGRGDKTPEVFAWYCKHDRAAAIKRYVGRVCCGKLITEAIIDGVAERGLPAKHVGNDWKPAGTVKIAKSKEGAGQGESQNLDMTGLEEAGLE